MTLAATRKSHLLIQAERILGKTATAVAVATGAGMACPTPAQAQIVYSGPVNIPIPLTTAGVYLNLVTGVHDPAPGNVPGWDINPWNGSTLSWFDSTANNYVVLAGAPTNLSLGTFIGPASTFGSGNSDGTFNFNSTNNYVGVQFTNESTAATDYGWVQVNLGASFTDAARAIVGYAYDNSGAPIATGATGVPEPSSLALLSLGAVGLVVRRRRRLRVA